MDWRVAKYEEIVAFVYEPVAVAVPALAVWGAWAEDDMGGDSREMGLTLLRYLQDSYVGMFDFSLSGFANAPSRMSTESCWAIAQRPKHPHKCSYPSARRPAKV